MNEQQKRYYCYFQFARTHKCTTKLKCCVEKLHCLQYFIANRHLANKLSCLHDHLNSTTIQLITLKLEKEVCKGRNTCPIFHPTCWLLINTNQLKQQSQT